MRLRHLAAVVTGLVIAAGIGLIAGSTEPEQFWLRTLVFAACTLGPAYGVGWLAFVLPRTADAPPRRVEESVEHDWWQRSASGSFLDVLTLAGLGACVLAVTGMELAASTVLVALVLFAFADVGVRWTVLRRRAA
ncbi:hypothetical protein [Modestobacter versicolor]|uniref:Uncharacterized protein n=1 Tax=Modestobacter versicolor TaxID=429133 RepID=A0A323VCS5_9ACTN|nr:hypothetical protein [Modestobacter versicolor]MBB3677610.1 hypothetical protein [Modestobacter versicolor]PZA21026.1 hypothetical protein DMO24_12400 [Modestobacter versicolor]